MKNVAKRTDRYLRVVLTIIAFHLTLLTLKDWVLPLHAARSEERAGPCVRGEEVLAVRIQEVAPLAFLNVLEALPVEVRTQSSFDAIPVRVTNKVAIEN